MTIVGAARTGMLARASIVRPVERTDEDNASAGCGSTASAPRRRVLILSAGVGGGHEAAARALHEELEGAGHEVVTVDGLRQMGATLDWFLRWTYAFQLRYAPWCYDLCFRVSGLPGIAHTLRILAGVIFGPRLARFLDRQQPDLVVSTYPAVTSGLGWLRRTGRLTVPAIAVVSDYNVHPLWVAPGIDRHLVVSEVSAPAARRVGDEVHVIRPPVAGVFHVPVDRAAARTALDLPHDALVALIVGGAWGLGDILEAAEQVIAAEVHAILVAGRNAELKARLERRFQGHPNVRILGWTNDMPRLMAAADCLVQNAGGLTCLEAITVGLPIIIYRPIPGHGLLNTQLMERAGAVVWARDDEDLRAMLRAAAAGDLQLPRPRQESGQPASEMILSAASGMMSVASLPRIVRRPFLTILIVLAVVAWATVTPRPSTAGRPHRRSFLGRRRRVLEQEHGEGTQPDRSQ